MASFRFRPAPARPARRVAHDAEGMSLDDGPWLPWSDLVELSFTVQSSRGVSFTTFRFKFSTQEAMLSMTGTPPEQHAFFHDMNRLLRDLAQARPEVEVRLGHVGGARIGMFLVGGAMGLVGLGLLLGGVVLGTEGDFAGAVVMGSVGLVAVFVGASFALSNSPRAEPGRVALSDLIGEIDRSA